MPFTVGIGTSGHELNIVVEDEIKQQIFDAYKDFVGDPENAAKHIRIKDTIERSVILYFPLIAYIRILK